MPPVRIAIAIAIAIAMALAIHFVAYEKSLILPNLNRAAKHSGCNLSPNGFLKMNDEGKPRSVRFEGVRSEACW
jgi:hypothetical protein